MRKGIICWLMLLGVMSAGATDTLFIGPRNMRVSEEGEFSWVDMTPTPQTFDNQWAYRLYPEDKKLTGRGVTVAIADSGISPHVEFNGKHIQGQDFTLSSSMADLKNHGTGVAGIIGAKGIRFTGIAPEASLLIYKIDDGSRMIAPQAVTAAVNTIVSYNEQNPGNRVSVLNLSYGVLPGGSAQLTEALERAYQNGIVIVCPSGNIGYPGVHYPASMGITIAVGALAADKTHAYANSSYGPQLDFIAPGDRIYTTDSDGEYTLMSGTSAAAGFVSAIAALAVEGLMRKLGRYPTVEEVKNTLKAASYQVQGIDPAKQGNGFIDVMKLEEIVGVR